MTRKLFLVLTLAALAACSDAPDPAGKLLSRAVSDGRLAGVVAMAADSDGTFVSAAAGSGNGERPMRSDTILRIASMTKAVTSVAVMQLVERGELGLDTALADVLPRFSDLKVYTGRDADGRPQYRDPATPVTIRQLLTHTSGFAYEIWDEDIMDLVRSGDAGSLTTGGEDFLDVPLVFDPGTGWAYGIGTDVLGLVVAEVSGEPLDRYFETHILKPLGMQDTAFTVPPEKRERVATLYVRPPDGVLVPIPQNFDPPTFLSGGGGLYSTAEDYLRFLRALLRGGELDGVRILAAGTVAQMAQNQIGELEAAESVVSMMPEWSRDFSFFPGDADKWGLGFLINAEPVEGGRAAGSLAWAGLFNSYYWIDRENDVTGLLMTQVLPFYDPASVELFSEFEKAVYAGR